jgi:hypothetical protein
LARVAGWLAREVGGPGKNVPGTFFPCRLLQGLAALLPLRVGRWRWLQPGLRCNRPVVLVLLPVAGAFVAVDQVALVPGRAGGEGPDALRPGHAALSGPPRRHAMRRRARTPG